MKIKVWGANPICNDFEELKYYNGNPQTIKVHGLKTRAQVIEEKRAKLAESYNDPIVKECVKETGMTPDQFQEKYNMAWNA